MLRAHQVRRVAMGEEHALVVTMVGLVLSWGRNDCGQLGTGDERPFAAPRVVRTSACLFVPWLTVRPPLVRAGVTSTRQRAD